MSENKKSFFDSVRLSALIAKKQAVLKKMEASDLREAFFKIGNAVLNRGTDLDQLSEHHKAIIDLDAEIEKKKTHVTLSETATIYDKAKHVTVCAKNRSVLEALLLRRKRLIADFGRDICNYEVDDKEITTLQDEVKRLEKSIQDGRAEVDALKQQVSGLAKKPFLALGIVGIVLILVIGAVAGLSSSFSESGQIKRATREAERDSADMQRQMLEIEVQIRNEQLAEEERRRNERAQRELEGRQRELVRQQQQAERDRLRETELERAAQQRRETQLAAEERRLADEQKRVQEQQDRAILAETRFKEITLKPNFYPSNSLLKYGATVEIRGQGWEEIKHLHESGNWLGLISFLLNQNHVDYPDARQIERAVDNLKRKELFILCRTTAQNTGESRIVLLTLLVSSRSAVSSSTSWQPHPDGIGYTHSWSLAHSGGIILYGHYWNEISPHVRRLNEAFSGRVSTLNNQRRLGEITEETHRERLSETIMRSHAEAIAWAREQ
jgi:hypothetical protein